MSDEQKYTIQGLDVEVVSIPFDWSETAYQKAYDFIYDRIQKSINK